MYNKKIKFSLWADFIERDYLKSEFLELINEGLINGATSNPAIFKNAILNSPAYKIQLERLQDETNPKKRYEEIAIYDIKLAASILEPLYEDGNDGYVSIEVNPFLCDNAEKTIFEGKTLRGRIGFDNVMIKVPATEAGYVAMEELVASGIPVNATLIFKEEQAIACAKAFEKGLLRGNTKVDTVISVFVSRIDRELDDKLKENNIETGLTGIYNAASIYNTIEKMNIDGCRTLFASTGVKGDVLPTDYYIEKLLATNSVNTAPVETIQAYKDNKNRDLALPIDNNTITNHLNKLKAIDINLDEILDRQIKDGLESFKEAFQDILDAV